MTAVPTVTVMSRSGCHRCSVVIEQVALVVTGTGYRMLVVDVDADPETRAEYGDQVPVVLIDGNEHDYGSVDVERLRAALR